MTQLIQSVSEASYLKAIYHSSNLWITGDDQDPLAADVPDDWERNQEEFSSQQLLPFIDEDSISKRKKSAGLNTLDDLNEVGEEIMKQQLQVSKRPQTPATPSQARYPPREVPPRFMQQQKQQQVKGKKAEVEFSGWGESGASDWDQVVVDDRDKDAWPSVGEERSDATWGVIGGEGMGSEYISASSSSPSPVSGSVITGSSGGPNSWPSLGDSRSCSLVTSETMSSVSGNSCGAQSPNHNDWGVSMTNCGNGNNSGNNGGLDVPGNGNGGVGGSVDASTRRTDSYRVTQHGHVQSSPISEGTNRQQILGDVLMEGVNTSSSMWGTGSSTNSESANGSGGPNSGGWRTANQQPQGHQQYARTSSGISQNGRNIPNNNVPTGSGLHINENTPTQNYGGAGGVGMGMHTAANSNLVNAQYSSSNGSSLADMQSDNSSGNNGGSGARNETRGGISGWNASSSRIGLLGGGESSVNTGTSGWGSASGSNNGSGGGSGWNISQSTNSAQSQWGAAGNGGNGSRNGGSSGAAVSQVSPTKPINTWAQAAGKGLNSGGGSSSSGSLGSCVIGQRESQPELEVRQAITSHDEWGQGSVNQDTAWDLPGGSEDSTKDKTAMWKASQNNGTEIWENTVRNGGKASNNVATPTNSQPWGANPSTNIGGTWGEEEDSSNVWTGVPQSGGARNSSSSDGWGGSGSGGGGSSGGNGNGDKMWNGPTKEANQWGSGNNSGGNNSGGNNGGGNNGGGNNGGGNNGGGNNGGGNNGSGNNGGGNNSGGNGSSSGWGEPCANNTVGSDGDDGTNAWGAPSPKVINQQRVTMPPKDLKIGGGWEEPSPPPARRGVASVDDGTAVWGSPNSHNKVSRWKEAPAMNTKGPNLSSQSSSSGQGQAGQGSGVIRIPPGTPTGVKPENNIGVWGKSVSQNRWGDANHEINNSWDDGMGNSGIRSGNNSSSGNSGGGNGSWGEPSSPLANNWENKSKSSSNWNDNMHVNTSNWGQPLKQGAKPLSKDLIWASRQFRLLHELGFKKEDVENALRNASMNYDDALHELQGGSGNHLQMGDNDVFSSSHHASIRGDDDHSSVMDASFPNSNASNFGNNIYTNSGIIGGGPNPTNAAFKSQANLMSNGNMFHGVSGHNNQLGNLMPSVANFNPNLVQKLLQQQQQQQLQQHQPQHLPQFQPNMGGGNRGNQQNVPSTNQLRLIVQQIQMAVTAGHLNPQILNQPLSPQTLLLLNQLLNQIKQLQQLQLASQPLGKPGGGTPLQISVQITKTKQQITNLQNQIVAQQAAYLKQQQLQQHLQQQQQHAAVAAANVELLKPPLDPLNLIHGGLQDLSVKDPTPGTPTSTSRLSQWKLPSMEKELDPTSNLGGNSLSGGDFSRAPGTVTKMPTGSSGFSATSIFGQNDSTWSLNRSHSDSGWPDGSSSGDSTMNGNGGASDQWSSSNQNYNIMEFEPGKPWKGSMKNVEDDPHITPGSVARSPLNAIKESELFNSLSKNNQVPSSENSFTTPNLSSATWSFNSANAPGPATSSAVNPGLNYSGGKFVTKWEMGSEAHAPGINSELWGNVSSKTRGPPPGLGSQNKIPVTSTWGNGGGGVNASAGNGIGNRQGWTASSGWERPTVSTWLMLRNLTPQIDGSTLRTLCMQHGPLSAFHLYLSQGIALVRYSSREEATKAQSALNNCVLGNTTIFAEFANEVDIQQFLQQSGNATNVAWGQQGNGGNNGSNGTGGNNVGMRANSSVAPSASSSSFTQYGNKNDAGGGGPSHWGAGGLNLHSGQLWSSLQSPPNSGNLWGNSTLTDSIDHRGTPSSLNSYLPGDLLGGESV